MEPGDKPERVKVRPGPPRRMPTAQDACIAIGNQKVLGKNGVDTLLSVLRNYFAPDVMGAARQDVSKFSHFRKTAQNAGENFAKFGLLPRKAEGRAKHGGGVPDAFASVLCLQNANLPCQEKSLVLASTHGNWATTDIARQMRRRSGPQGTSGKQDTLFGDHDCPGTSPPVE